VEAALGDLHHRPSDPVTPLGPQVFVEGSGDDDPAGEVWNAARPRPGLPLERAPPRSPVSLGEDRPDNRGHDHHHEHGAQHGPVDQPLIGGVDRAEPNESGRERRHLRQGERPHQECLLAGVAVEAPHDSARQKLGRDHGGTHRDHEPQVLE
jgi:hypothetical protein